MLCLMEGGGERVKKDTEGEAREAIPYNCINSVTTLHVGMAGLMVMEQMCGLKVRDVWSQQGQ